jgi:hypothetical protein
MGKFVVIQECSAGNSQVGDMWLETATFPPETTLVEVWAWAKIQGATSVCGRTMIRPDRNDMPKDDNRV